MAVVGIEERRVSMRTTRDPREEPNVGAALERVVEASRELVETRIALARLELRERATHSGRAAALLALGGSLAALAWLAFNAAAAMALSRVLPADAAVAVVATVNLLIAGGCAAAARREVKEAKGTE